MKLKHENLVLIEGWLDANNRAIEFSDEFVREVYDQVLEHRYKLTQVESPKKRDRYYKLQYDFVRRDLLKIAYKKNDKSASGIQAGYVYAIGNPAWPDYTKVGSAIDVVDRLASYQTGSPYRDFFLIDYYFSYDRLREERRIHGLFDDKNAEWCKITHDDAKALFKQMKADNTVDLTEEKRLEGKKILLHEIGHRQAKRQKRRFKEIL